MKMITAVIKPVEFDNVYAALEEIGVAGITATEVRAVGHPKGRTELHRGAEYTVSFRTKIKIEFAVTDEQLDAVIEVITHAAHIDANGEDKVFVTSLEQAIRIIHTSKACATP
jgi:nitrogen regulatory protein P-II 2